MDSIDTFVITSATLYVAYLLVQLATECAQRVWDRAKADLDLIDLFEAAHVPTTSNTEAIIILLGVATRTFFTFPIELAKRLMLSKAQRVELRYSNDRKTSATDILGCVSMMMSGYPERAIALFEYELSKRTDSVFDAQRRDHEKFQMAQLN